MKKVVIILSLICALGFVALGFYLKTNEGYLLSNKQDIIEVLQRRLGVEDSITILNTKEYQKDNNSFYMVYAKGFENYYFLIFKENDYQKYEEYYTLKYNGDTSVTLFDTQHQFFVIFDSNVSHHLTYCVTIDQSNEYQFSSINEQDDYIIYCVDNKDNQMIDAYLSDGMLERRSNRSYAQENIY